MKYFIYAYPAMYGGRHGMYKYEACDYTTVEEAYELGRDMAFEVIEDFNLAHEIYTEEDYMEEYETNVIDDKFYEELDEHILEECSYEVYPLKDNVSVDDINQCRGLDLEEIIELYCKEAV